MARHGIGTEQAFDLLRQQSQSTNRTLRAIAAELVQGASGRPPTPGRPLTV